MKSECCLALRGPDQCAALQRAGVTAGTRSSHTHSATLARHASSTSRLGLCGHWGDDRGAQWARCSRPLATHVSHTPWCPTPTPTHHPHTTNTDTP